MLAGAAAGAHRGQSGHRRGGESDLQLGSPQPGHHGSVVGVGVQQLGTKPVHEQHARTVDAVRKGDRAVKPVSAHCG